MTSSPAAPLQRIDRSHWRWRLRRFGLHDPEGLVGSVALLLVIMAAFLAGVLAPMDPERQNIALRLLPPGTETSGYRFWLGTDELGRDLLSRVIFGTRVSLSVGFGAVLLSAAFGTAVGILSGYYGGSWDDLLMRVTDVQLAFPSILLSLAIVAILGAGLRNLELVLAIAGWVGYARIARSRVLGVRQLEFIEAAHALGAPDRRILWRHVLPNVLPSMFVIASFSLGGMITSEAALTFLGLGVPANIPSWGGMLTSGAQYVSVAWWLATFPGLAIMLTVLAANLLGDWLRDALDPRLR